MSYEIPQWSYIPHTYITTHYMLFIGQTFKADSGGNSEWRKLNDTRGIRL